MNSLIPSLTQNAAKIPTPPIATNGAPQAAAQNPLDQLKDIRLPSAIDSFPYAPGWWILLAILLSVLGYYLFKRYQYQKAIRLLKPARKELEQLASLSGELLNAKAIATLSALLKRVCLLYFPKIQVASLNGASWLAFLNEQTRQPKADPQGQQNECFSEKDIELFSTAAYRKDARIESQQWQNLIASSELCIERIITDAANKKIKPTRSRSEKSTSNTTRLSNRSSNAAVANLGRR